MQTTEQRFWEKVRWRSNGCFEWVGAIGWNFRRDKAKLPYGRFYFNGKTGMAHHYAYERVHGPIPKGLEIDHTCRFSLCVNVEHLEAVTHQTNWERATGNVGLLNRAKTSCPNGHVYDEENTRYYNGQRICRRCNADRMRAERAEQGVAARAMATETRCANGHLWSEDNERVVCGRRVCRTCHNQAKRRYLALKRVQKE